MGAAWEGPLCRRCAQRSTRQKGALFPPKLDLAWSSYHKGHAKDKEEPGSCGGPDVYRLNPQDEHPPPVETLSTLDPVFVPLAILPANCWSDRQEHSPPELTTLQCYQGPLKG